eukprot:g18339.t1
MVDTRPSVTTGLGLTFIHLHLACRPCPARLANACKPAKEKPGPQLNDLGQGTGGAITYCVAPASEQGALPGWGRKTIKRSQCLPCSPLVAAGTMWLTLSSTITTSPKVLGSFPSSGPESIIRLS